MTAMLSNEQRLDWLQLMKSENVGPATFRTLINRFGGARSALDALPELSKRGGLRRRIRIYPRQAAERDFANLSAFGGRFIALGEDGYPPLLRHISDAPALICAKGRIELLNSDCIAMVGARNASAIGRKFARQVASDLGAGGCTVVSGLARGIDTAAHEASLERGTIAVVAGGLDVIYPPENAKLHAAIAQDGVIVSEMTPGTRPKAEFFPRRNRIISGISHGVIVVEAALRSGSLITARMAGEQGRDVFAVPGSPMDPRAAGTNKLIRDGAILVRKADDVLEAMSSAPSSGLALRQAFSIPSGFDQFADDTLTGDAPDNIAANERDHILSLLSATPVELDDLIRESGLAAATVVTIILELELAGRVERQPGARICLAEGSCLPLFE